MSFQFNFFDNDEKEESIEADMRECPEAVQHKICPKLDNSLGQVKEICGVKYRIRNKGN